MDGAVKGVSVDLAHRLGLPADLIVYETAGKVTDAANAGAWDVCFLAIEPARAALIDFTAPYVIIEGTYLVDVASPLKNVADVDHDGIRIAVARGSAYDLYLSRTLRHATLVRYPARPWRCRASATRASTPRRASDNSLTAMRGAIRTSG